MDWKASAKTGQLQVREFAREDERRVLLVFDPSVLAPTPTSEQQPVLSNTSFERGVSMCASLAWHFHELNSVLGFRTVGSETPLNASGEVIYDILGQLAIAAPHTVEAGRALLEEIADIPQTFKIIITCQPHGSIPASLWGSSYVLFID